MARITKKQVQEEYALFNCNLHVVAIDPKNPNRRDCHASGLNLHAAFREIINYQAHGIQCLAFRDKDIECVWAEMSSPVDEQERLALAEQGKAISVDKHTWDIAPYKKAASYFMMPWDFGRIK